MEWRTKQESGTKSGNCGVRTIITLMVEVVADVRTSVGSARRSKSPVASRDDLYMYTHTYTHTPIVCEKMDFDMGWLRLVGSIKL